VVIVRRYGLSIILIISIISLDSFIAVKDKAQIYAEQDTEEVETLEEETECSKGNIEQEEVSKDKETEDEKLLQKEINGLIKELAEGDIIDQYKAGRKLKKIGKQAVPALIDAAKGDNKRLRKTSMVVLGQIKDESAVPILVEELEKTKDKKLKAGLIIILGRIGDKRASPTLMKALNEESEEVVAAAAYALGKLKEENAVPFLIPLLGHSNEYVRREVTKALKKIGDPAIPVLTKDMEHKPLNNRYLIITILGKIGGEKAIHALLEALKDNNEYIRLSAAESLSELGNDKGYELAVKNLNSIRPEYQIVAKKTLENLGKKIEWDEGKREYVVLK
jgi:HEAT repeat protein